MSRITNTYGHALGTLVERHNTRPEHLEQRNRDLQAENDRLRAEVKQLRTRLAAFEDNSAFEQRQPTGGIPLKKWHKQNSLSYWKAYRLVSSGKIPAYQEGRNWFVYVD